MRQPEVSVIIPTYESASYLPEALRSVFDQTLDRREIELIVVDDGSSDDVAGAISPFQDYVGLIRIEHAGVSAARNAGISASNGRYVAFLDADDFWLPERLETLLRLARDETDAILSTDFYHEVDGQHSNAGYYEARGLLPLFRAPAKAQYVAALSDNFISYMQLVSRHLFGLVGYFDAALSYGEDYDLWLRFLEAGIPARAVERPLAIYRYLRPGATTTSSSIKKAEDRVTVLQRRRRDVPESRWRDAAGRLCHARLRHSLQVRAYAAALKEAWQLARNPGYLKKWAIGRR